MNKKVASITLIILAGLLGLSVWIPSQYVVPVLMYHSVAAQYDEPLNNVRPESFVRQMDFIKRHGYQVISTSELVAGLRAGKKFALNTVVITFDDGLDNNYTFAYPVLKERSFSATMFIPSDEVGRAGRVTWLQVKDMAAHGIVIGSHTRTETYVPDVESQALWEEIAGSKRILETELGRPVDFIAYPVGGFTEKAESLAHSAGYLAAFTTNRGRSKKNNDLFAVRRIRIKDSDRGLVLMAKLSGFYNFFRSVRCPY
ncbi:MAG: polysaccharide deacetylase family protein [Candidatus Omnitrophica bacterium]|nr:polysaccharide deacetylase family protein [Candidatus Omnitrophota bacterium]